MLGHRAFASAPLSARSVPFIIVRDGGTSIIHGAGRHYSVSATRDNAVAGRSRLNSVTSARDNKVSASGRTNKVRR